MKKLLIFQNELSGYNVPVYNRIAEFYDLTVAFYLKDKSNIDCKFKKFRLEFKKLGPIVFIRGISSLTKRFDVVCFIPDLHNPSYFLLPFKSHKYKLVNWSIGFRASYSHPYEVDRPHNILDRIFQLILSTSDASIFYMEKAKDFWKRTNLDMNKVFVAPNTTAVVPIVLNKDEKRNFLFVGTLYKGKGLDKLLESYRNAVIGANIKNQLHIVGEGTERDNLERFVSENGLSGKVFFHGAIYDENKLSEYFSKALICISPTQGGLSVPKSMGYGVPFITRKDAITGGEIYHITPNENGIMYDKDEELTSIMIDCAKNAQKYYEMGVKAKDYYCNNATINHMAQGAMDAFDYTMKQD